MKYFMIAGERSGDMHAGKLAEALYKADFDATIVGVGGQYMKDAGVELLKQYQSFSFMGIVEVITNLTKVLGTIRSLKDEVLKQKPDVLILIDFPGINLKIATYARKLGIQTCYYISPKIWAWKAHRIQRIKRDIDKMLVILPFETAYYAQRNYTATYVGNPTVEAIKSYEFDPSFEENHHFSTGKITIAVLPGSRKQEIKASVKVIGKVAARKPQWQFLIAAVDNVAAELYDGYRHIANANVVFDKTYDVLKHCNASIVTSGTATLEAALLSSPQVVVYRANALSVYIAKLLVSVPWISLVNLIAEKAVVKELIQQEYNTENVLNELSLILNDHGYAASMLSEYLRIKDLLGYNSAARQAANSITNWG